MEHPNVAEAPDAPSTLDGGDRQRPPSPPPPGHGPARRTVPSARPALVVVGIAAGLLLLFGIGAALTGSSGSPPSKPSSTPVVKGTSLRAEAAASALRPIERPGTPPADVLSAVVLPAGSVAVSHKPWDGTTQFNGEMTFRLRASQATLVQFYRTALKARDWSISSVGAAEGTKGATEVLAQRASTDGWYWEIGVVVSPTTFATTSSGAAAAGDTTRFSVDLFEEPDTG